jgi:hypothetical protein
MPAQVIDPRELIGTPPGRYNPRDFVQRVDDQQDPSELRVMASYVPTGYGFASQASESFVDAFARRIDPTARVRLRTGSGRGGAAGLGYFVHVYTRGSR